VVPHADRRPWYVDRPWPSFAHTGCLLPLAVLFFATSFVTGESWFARVGMLVPSGLYLVWWALGVAAGVIRDARGIPHPERSTEQRSTTEQRIMTERRITEVVERHAATLRRKRRQLIRVDDYGNVFADAWEREMDYFVANVVARALGSGLSFQDREYARQEVVRVARALDDHFDGVDVASMSPIEYEHHCADLLRRAGWDARVTSASGDQGVDIVATRGGRTLVVQAKRYSGSVGNAAVQEVLAGKQFMGADLAAVVSPAPFTRSAVELANVTGVRLVHHEQLADL
jgi:restriction system protein